MGSDYFNHKKMKAEIDRLSAELKAKDAEIERLEAELAEERAPKHIEHYARGGG